MVIERVFESMPEVEPAEPEPFDVVEAVCGLVDDAAVEPLDRLRGWARVVAHAQARLFEAMTAVVDAVVAEAEVTPDEPLETVEAVDAAAVEIATALHLTRRAAEGDLDFALELRRLPAVHAALRAGRLDRRRAGVLVHGTAHLPTTEARAVTDRLVDRAAHWTAGQLRARLARALMDTDPEAAADRYRRAVADRRVVLEATETGTATFFAFDLPADRAHAARRRIEALARSLVGDAEPRSLDQLRADVFLDLLLGTGREADRQGPNGAGVHLTVDLATLARLSDHAGDLDGYGPVVADLARQIAADQTATPWTWSVVDPDGTVVATGITRRRPSAALRRTVTTRRPRCGFPGCRMPARDCDLDHTRPWSEGGSTTPDNLQPLCRHHHRHHHRGWHYEPLPDGTLRWTSPLGQTVDVHPDDTSRPPP